MGRFRLWRVSFRGRRGRATTVPCEFEGGLSRAGWEARTARAASDGAEGLDRDWSDRRRTIALSIRELARARKPDPILENVTRRAAEPAEIKNSISLFLSDLCDPA